MCLPTETTLGGINKNVTNTANKAVGWVYSASCHSCNPPHTESKVSKLELIQVRAARSLGCRRTDKGRADERLHHSLLGADL